MVHHAAWLRNRFQVDARDSKTGYERHYPGRALDHGKHILGTRVGVGGGPSQSQGEEDHDGHSSDSNQPRPAPGATNGAGQASAAVGGSAPGETPAVAGIQVEESESASVASPTIPTHEHSEGDHEEVSLPT